MNTTKFIVDSIRKIYDSQEYIPLLEPVLKGNEQKYVADAIANSNVASQGKYIKKFEAKLCEVTGSEYVICTSSGTSALHIALLVVGVEKNDEVLTQSLSFVATANAISYCGASPNFMDVDLDSLGMSPKYLKEYLEKNSIQREGYCYNKHTGNKISACMPMHTFGNPLRIDEIVSICNEYHIEVVEDAAQALGSFYKGKHVGTFGRLGVFSFNGNKIITSGGGGCICTDDEQLAKKIRFLINQAKEDYAWEYVHSEIGYNYKMPNLNAALGLGQLEQLDDFLIQKKELYQKYKYAFEENKDIQLVDAIDDAISNNWLQTILFDDSKERDNFLKFTHQNNIQTRAVWKPLHQLSMFKNLHQNNLNNTEYLSIRLVNLPSMLY